MYNKYFKCTRFFLFGFLGAFGDFHLNLLRIEIFIIYNLFHIIELILNHIFISQFLPIKSHFRRYFKQNRKVFRDVHKCTQNHSHIQPLN